MPSEISVKYEQFKRIHRNEETYGVDQEPSDQARRFRIAEILPLVIKKIRGNWRPPKIGPVDLLVSLSGHSPETAVVTFELLRPEHLLVVQSEGSPESIDTLMEHLDCPPSRIEVRKIDPNDPLDIYNQVRGDVERTRRRSPRKFNAVIDITGGKKIMSAAAALAATQLELRLCYIDGEYDSAVRQPIPGTENPLFIPNPTDLFMDREMDKACELLAHGDFPASFRRFEEIAARTVEPARARFGRDLAHCYWAWSKLDHANLRSRIAALQERMDAPGFHPSYETLERLETQLEFLSAFVANANGIELTLSYFLAARHHRRCEQHELAVQLYYRSLEHLLFRLLERRAPGFDCESPVWSMLGADLEARYLSIVSRVYGPESPQMPASVGLMDAAILLNALEDPIMEDLDLAGVNPLKGLRGQIKVRNRSVLAHGTENVDAYQSRKFENFIRHRLERYWELEPDRPPFNEYLDTLKFIEHI
ncbi:TIGR02710 family CRISPR-associated CARF protein [Glycomyces xiaoerkulensis]|uniref:TIGR02710 family CRISPR-associated CARF protein n=1 Tax=Glycomyces xiaoerkulensis TaxID=2038139 RepID=UPI001300077B|nr:TIGR02710 family CRISPR-associated CARF protein [Glycomyces xiaoerkulensis]